MIRQANPSDLPSIMEIIMDAKELLRKSGSSQWNTSDGYPTEEVFLKDIYLNQLYVYEEDKILGVMSCVLGNESNYDAIKGKWAKDSVYYLTIHRIAVKKEYYHKGIAIALIRYAKQFGKNHPGCTSIRIDTHPKNLSMQNLIRKQEFIYCGIIQLNQTEDGLRLAYEYIL